MDKQIILTVNLTDEVFSLLFLRLFSSLVIVVALTLSLHLVHTGKAESVTAQ